MTQSEAIRASFWLSSARRLKRIRLLRRAVVEQEYQKRHKEHGTKIRPDLIIHLRTRREANRRSGNYVAIELNLKAGAKEAQEDFANIDELIRTLNYPLGLFLNIASDRTHASEYAGPFRDRIHFVAVRHRKAEVMVTHAHYVAGKLVVKHSPAQE